MELLVKVLLYGLATVGLLVVVAGIRYRLITRRHR